MYQKKEILTYFLVFIFQICSSTDTIGPNQSLKDGNILVSSGNAFALGFFSPGKSRNRYIGIWYNEVPEQTVVWVANRDNPINGTSGVFAIDPAGNLVLSDESRNLSVWSTNVSSITLQKSSSAQLMETGNLLLCQDQSKSVIAWQSFDYPTNTILPNMKAGWNRRTGLNPFFRSWKSHDDPGTGEYVFKLELNGTPQFFLYKGSDWLWRTGPWNGLRWSGVPEMNPNFVFNISYVENDDEETITYVMKDPSIFSRMVLNESGTLERLTWQGPERGWSRFWYAPKDQWFEPQLERQWYLREASHGCKRKQEENVCEKWGGIYQAFAIANISEGGNGCITWHGNLVDIRQFSNNGQDLYIRVSAAELAQNTRNSKGFHGKRLATTVVASIVGMLLILFLASWLAKKKRKGAKRETKPLYSSSTGLTSYDSGGKEMDGSGTNAEVSVFDVNTIVSATDDFSQSNKLGEGGFGAVYKVWDSWREERALDIVDSSLDNSYDVNKILRCIHVGLLCVQECAPDRPIMSEVAFMLCNETRLPYPKRPAFIFNTASTTPYSKSASAENRSVNDMSITMVEAR
ncbi:S-locus lectin protein kinase family protein [Abeliophyllum distichum]|uniref:S-locus lectin protein kinase family protein n=1 Tax=Abeliophyllum distichum TaxID=126358 RepID=A0ABD1QI93_9LAMI